ncbi:MULTISPECIES: hypothetical protein [unclassified Novosphingobium]|uniref:hypothetical protein n=1 Tax=unclassified Novosphingobium TaxID=2644732 RepID=UPI0025D87610|nr:MULTISPECIES: hypothetical protein [unclassified Novosphingobium]HQV03695.1 hypothetical protein [Novosphingobium sp.]
MKVSRRTVFGSAAAAAAAAVVPSVASAAVANGDRKRLADKLARGEMIENEHFEFFDGKPVMIGGPAKFRLRNCRFTWHGKAPAGYLAFTRQNSGEMANCVFEHASGAARPMTIRKI